MVGGDQALLDHVLDALDVRRRVAEAVDQHLHHLGGQQIGFGLAEFAAGLPGPQEGRTDFRRIESRPLAVALDDFAWHSCYH